MPAESEVTYTASTVAAAAGLPEITLRKWRTRGRLEIAPPYSFSDLLRVAARAELLRLGIPINSQAESVITAIELDLASIAEGRDYVNVPKYALVTLLDNETPTVQSLLSAAQLQARLVNELKHHGVAIALNASAIVVRVMRFLTTNGHPVPSLTQRW